MDAARQVAQLCQRLMCAAPRVCQNCCAASGSDSNFCSARPRLMPSATRRACAPSCRSRSIRRSSASCWSTAPARVVSSTAMRSLSPRARVAARCIAKIAPNARIGHRGQKYPRVVTPQTSTRETAIPAETPACMARPRVIRFRPTRSGRSSTRTAQACTPRNTPKGISVHIGQKYPRRRARPDDDEHQVQDAEGRRMERERAPAPPAHHCRTARRPLDFLAAEQAGDQRAGECGERAHEQERDRQRCDARRNEQERAAERVDVPRADLRVRPAVVDRQGSGAGAGGDERQLRDRERPAEDEALKEERLLSPERVVLKDVPGPPPEAGGTGRGDARLDARAEERVRERRLGPRVPADGGAEAGEDRDDEWVIERTSESVQPVTSTAKPNAPSGIAETR